VAGQKFLALDLLQPVRSVRIASECFFIIHVVKLSLMPKQLCRWTQPGHPSVDGHGKYQHRWRLCRKNSAIR